MSSWIKTVVCTCFTELYFFYWLFVVSFVILIAVPFVFSRLVNIACRSTQNAGRIKRFWRLHIDIKNKHNKLFIMLERNSINAHSKTRPQLTLQKWESAGRIGNFGNFLDGLAKSQRVLSILLNSEWVQFVYLYCKVVKYCILSEVCMIKTVPHSTVSPQMWCINCIKGWFTRTQI